MMTALQSLDSANGHLNLKFLKIAIDEPPVMSAIEFMSTVIPPGTLFCRLFAEFALPAWPDSEIKGTAPEILMKFAIAVVESLNYKQFRNSVMWC